MYNTLLVFSRRVVQPTILKSTLLSLKLSLALTSHRYMLCYQMVTATLSSSCSDFRLSSTSGSVEGKMLIAGSGVCSNPSLILLLTGDALSLSVSAAGCFSVSEISF